MHMAVEILIHAGIFMQTALYILLMFFSCRLYDCALPKASVGLVLVGVECNSLHKVTTLLVVL